MAPALVALALVASVGAEGSTRALSLAEALSLADRHPAIAAAAGAADAHQAFDDALGPLTANPELRVYGGVRRAPAPDEGPEFNVSLEQPINLAGQAGARRAAAAAEQGVLRADVTLERRARRLATVDAWAMLRLAEGALRLAHEELAVARSARSAIERGVAAGVGTRVDGAEAEAFEAELEVAVVDAEGAWFEAELTLGRVLALAPEARLATRGEGLVVDPARVVELSARLDPNPAIVARRRALERVERLDAELDAERGPWLFAGGQWIREGSGDTVAQAMLGVRVPLFEHAARQRAPLRAERLVAEARLALERVEQASLLAEAAHEVVHQREREDVLGARALPVAERLVALRRRALEVSESTALELLQAERRRVAIRRALVEQTARRLRADGALAVLLEEDAR
jgi:outer membrane protein TolC